MRKARLIRLKREFAILVLAVPALATLALWTWSRGPADYPARFSALLLLAIIALALYLVQWRPSGYQLHPGSRTEPIVLDTAPSRSPGNLTLNFDPNNNTSSPTGAHRAIADGAPVRPSLNFPEDGLRQFFLILPEYCFLVGHDGAIIDSNPAACEALEYRREELAGRLFYHLSSPESSGKMKEAFERWKTEGDLRSLEVDIHTKRGERRTVLLNIGSIKRSDGRVILAMSVLVDITERKRNEQAIKESEERFRLAINTAPMMVWVAGTDKLCSYFNKAWLDFTGRPIEAQLGNGWVEGVHPEDLQQCVETYEQSFDQRREFRMEYRLRHHDGEYRWIIDIGVPRLSPEGLFAGYIGSCVDVTDRKRSEDNRVTMLEQIAHLNRAASMGQLAASLAHELAQPLAAILSNAQAASRFANMPEPDLSEIKGALAEITEDDQRARGFLFNMRAMFQKQKISRSVLDLNGIVHDVDRIIRNDAVRKGVQIRVSPSPDAVLVSGDPIVVQQVILNLANNAMDALQHVPLGQKLLTLTSSLNHDGSVGTIVVEDNGCGIADENKPRLFMPFFTTKQDGMGLGLSICRSLIESLDGRIMLVEGTEPGAAFKVELPVTPEVSVLDAHDPEFSQPIRSGS
jgi:PAS domain S-box-containing protein